MICEKCGAEIELGKIFCPECGCENSMVPEYNVAEDADFIKYLKDIEDNQNKKDVSRANTYVSKPWHLFLAVLACLIVFFGCCYFIYYSFVNSWFSFDFLSSDKQVEAVATMAKGAEGNSFELFGELYDATSDSNYLMYQYKCAKNAEDLAEQKSILETVLQEEPDNLYAITGLIDVYLNDKDYDSFYRLYAEKPEFSNLFSNYALPEPVFVKKKKGYHVGDTLAIKAVEGVNIYYTIDDKDPIESGKMYVAPIALTAGEYVVKARVVDSTGMYSPISELAVTVEKY